MSDLARILDGRWRLRARSLSGDVRHLGYTGRFVALAVIVALVVGLAAGFTVKAASRGSQEPGNSPEPPHIGRVATDAMTAVPAPLPSPQGTAGPVGVSTAPPSPAPAVRTGGRWHSIRTYWYGPGLWYHHMADGGILTPSTWAIASSCCPLGTWVELRWGGRVLRAQVRDRHGKAAVDFFDLSAALSTALFGTPSNHVIAWRIVP